MSHITVACYTHPELYPPVLSAIQELSPLTEGIEVITRDMLDSHWNYPANVSLYYVNKTGYKGFEIETIPVYKKLWHFISFVKQIQQSIIKHKSQVLIVHDVIPLFAAYMLRHMLKKHRVALWYHNHDVTDLSKAGKLTVMGIAARFEHKAFNNIDLFTLPAQERLAYFPIHILANTAVVIPNYPLKQFYKAAVKTGAPKNTIKLVFQGSIGPGHGLEDLIGILNTPINGKQPELHLVGKVRPPYLKKLEDLAVGQGVSARLYYHGMKPFAKLPEFLVGFDIGLAIHEPYNITYATGGSASNKIYEYAACGLPVLLLDNPHYRSYLGHLSWAFFTGLTQAELTNAIAQMDAMYPTAASAARSDFEEQFNYELHFRKQLYPVISQLFFNT